MTNEEIIYREAVAHNLYTEEEAMAIYDSGCSLPIHTVSVWNGLGYKVRKGEHAKIVTRLWKYKKKSEKMMNEGEEIEVQTHRMYLAKAHLFMIDQVEKMDA